MPERKHTIHKKNIMETFDEREGIPCSTTVYKNIDTPQEEVTITIGSENRRVNL